MNPVRVRFAPSPTGFLHLGGLRTALYDFLFARRNGGTFILRIEDTDRNRLVPGAVDNLVNTLHKLGLDIDEGPGKGGAHGPYTQSERLAVYHREAARLLDSGHAYRCFCTPETLSQMREVQQAKGEFVKYDRRCLRLPEKEIKAKLQNGEPHVLRLRMPDDHTFAFLDLIRGRVEMDSSQSDDQVLLKSDGFPTYHLAAVVDDHYMEISHVIRGEEWLSSTPKHLWLYECLSWQPPLWVHLPLILNPDRTKLSKRVGDVSVESYLDKGYLPEALVNFVALLGWHGADDRELFSLGELCREFSLERVNKAGAVFDLTKLDWMNGWYLRNLPLELVTERALPWFEAANIDVPEPAILLKIVAAARERCTLLPEIAGYSRMFLCPRNLTPEEERILATPEAQSVLNWFSRNLPPHGELSDEELDALVKNGIQATGLKGKHFYTPLRLALIHQPHGPELPATFAILGLSRIHTLLQDKLRH